LQGIYRLVSLRDPARELVPPDLDMVEEGLQGGWQHESFEMVFVA
jgi:hypothetical protein